jgi:hypothetical protein
MIRLLPALGVLWALGCTPTTTGTTCEKLVIPESIHPEKLYFPGDAVSLAVQIYADPVCTNATEPQVKSAQVEVTDPLNRPVSDAAVTQPTRLTDQYGQGRWETTVSFSPKIPGAYHVIVTFEPGQGLVQREVWAVLDRRDAGFTTLTLPGPCDHVEKSFQGAVLCQQQNLTAQVLRDGVELAYFTQAVVHIVNNVVWVADQQGLRRFVDDGSGPLRLTAQINTTLDADPFAATQDDALVCLFDRLRLYHYADGGLANESDVKLSLTTCADRLAFSRAARSLVVGVDARWARVDMPLGESTPTPAWTLPTEREVPAFQSDGVLWANLDPATWRAVPADPVRAKVTLSAPSGWRHEVPIPTLHIGERPVMVPVDAEGFPGEHHVDATRALIPQLGGTTPQLAHYATPPDAGFVEVTQGQLRAVRGKDHFFWNLDP